MVNQKLMQIVPGILKTIFTVFFCLSFGICTTVLTLDAREKQCSKNVKLLTVKKLLSSPNSLLLIYFLLLASAEKKRL